MVCFKKIFSVENFSNANEFDLHENGEAYFQIDGSPTRFVTEAMAKLFAGEPDRLRIIRLKISKKFHKVSSYQYQIAMLRSFFVYLFICLNS